MNKDIDTFLNQVLTPDYQPGELLNRRIINQVKETKNMKHKKIIAASVAAALITATSITAVAAGHFLTAKDVAVELDREDLVPVFDKSEIEKAIQVTEQEGYRFAFLGAVSGTNLVNQMSDANPEETYVVIAAEKTDGTAFSKSDFPSFVVSPLIQGLNPIDYNIYALGGGGISNIIDGTYYTIMSYKNIEMFADRQIYIAITTGPFYSEAYNYDADTGLISVNENFDGLNVLFPVSLDAAKSDKSAQDDFLSDLKQAEEEALNKPHFSGDAGRAPISENVVNIFSDEAINFAANVDYNKLDAKDMETVLSFGTLLEEGSVARENGFFTIYYNNEYMSGAQKIPTESIKEDIPELYAAGADDSGITFEYLCSNGWKVDYAVYRFDKNQVQKIYDYFH